MTCCVCCTITVYCVVCSVRCVVRCGAVHVVVCTVRVADAFYFLFPSPPSSPPSSPPFLIGT